MPPIGHRPRLSAGRDLEDVSSEGQRGFAVRDAPAQAGFQHRNSVTVLALKKGQFFRCDVCVGEAASETSSESDENVHHNAKEHHRPGLRGGRGVAMWN